MGSMSAAGSPGSYRATILPPAMPIIPGRPTTLYLRLQDTATGLAPQALEIIHEKPVHMFLVSRDMSDFQHIHPQVVGPGLLEIPATFAKTGAYSVFAQFKPLQQAEQTVASTLQVPGRPMPAPPLQVDRTNIKTLWEPDAAGNLQAYTYQVANLPVTVGQPVRFQVNVLKNGQPVQGVEPFLGAAGHAIVLSANHDAFAHAHAMDGMKPNPNMPACHTGMAMAGQPSLLHFESDESIRHPGVYKAWVQTQVDGRVRTVDWTFQVSD